ncbi:Uncharacterised protein [Mycobacterium tuberculosis]|nr:Uncharacterised protein [Mycobacterium tuberculosis]
MPEHRVARHARHQLDAAAWRHFLDQQPIDGGIGLVMPGRGHDVVPCQFHLQAMRNADLDAADVRLVQDVGAGDLRDHGVAHAIGQQARLGPGAGHGNRQQRDAGLPEQRLGFQFRQVANGER